MEVVLDDTQVLELGGKRWKQDEDAKEMLTSCADDAASKAAKEMMTLMVRDVEKREQRLVDRLTSDFDQRNKRMMEHLDDVVKWISESLEVKMTNLEAKVQNQWTASEKKWEEKIVDTLLHGGNDKSGRIPYSDDCAN